MNNETKKNETKRQLSLPRVTTSLKAGQQSMAAAMPPPGRG